MAKTIKTEFTEDEFRRIIREELKSVLNNEAGTDQESFMNLDQAVEFSKLSKATIYAKTSTNSIPFIKMGKKLLFKKSDLSAWLNNR